MNLEELRGRIDALDSQILQCLDERMRLALRTRHLKPDVADKGREVRIFEKLMELTRSLKFLSFDFVEKIYVEVIRESKRLQSKEKP